MSLFQRPLRPPATVSDEAVERYLAAVRADLSVDPLFRRRLRGAVVNRFVADREASTSMRRGRRQMGGLGRAVLYASFALSVSVTTAMAASQGAVPGDALYPLKVQIEQLRLQALPVQFHDDLAAHSLGERIHELGVLAERGDWARVTSLAAAVTREYEHFVDTTRGHGASANSLVVLTALLDRLPERAQTAIMDVRDGVEDAAEEAGIGERPAGGQGSEPGRSDGRGGGAPTVTDPSTTPKATPRPARSERPEPTPRASRSPRPSLEPSASPSPEPAGD